MPIHYPLLSAHAHRVSRFMELASQDTPPIPMMPDEKTRELRAKLILEEVLETIQALGVTVTNAGFIIEPSNLNFAATHEPDMVEIVDGCCDVAVVTTGTLIACGVPDMEAQRLVDENNLAKFGPGGYRSDGTDGNPAGKWVKPPGHKPPDIDGLLERLGWRPAVKD